MNITLDFVGRPGYPPYERGRELASLLITKAVHGQRSKDAHDDWVFSLVNEVRGQVNESLSSGDCTALVATYLHLSLAAARFCECFAGSLSRAIDTDCTSDVVDHALQRVLAVLEKEALSRRTEGLDY